MELNYLFIFFCRVKCYIVYLFVVLVLLSIVVVKEKGVSFIVEICYYYLFFNVEIVLNGNILYKCCSFIREKKN